jgi:ABC-2 type transport system permease protein
MRIGLRRIARLYGLYARLDLLWVTQNLKTALLWILTDLLVSLASITGIALLATRFSGIGPWTRPQVLFLLGYVTAVGGLQDMFFNFNVAFISRRLGRGQLDHQLIQPMPLSVSFITEGFAPFSTACTSVVAAGILIWSCASLHLAVTPLWLLALAINLGASLLVLMAFQYIWGSLAFWAPRGAEEVSSSTFELISQLKQFPLDSVGPVLLGALSTFVPVAFIGWYPCRFLVGMDHRPFAAWITPLAALILAIIAYSVFNVGLRHYGKVGSQRYSSFGFRS